MPIKQLAHPTHGTVKLGRRRPHWPARRLSLRDYLAVAKMPGVPLTTDYSAKALNSLQQINMNDTLGCCVEAGQFHIASLMTGNTGVPFAPTDTQVVSLYSAEGGYVSGDPSTDNGTDEQTAFAYWKSNGLLNDGTHKIAGVLAVDATSEEELRSALWLFENLCFGIELPDAWINPVPSGSGFVWDSVGNPDPSNGHFVVGVGTTLQGITFDTWGMIGTLTYRAIAQYCVAYAGGDVSVVISTDSLNKAMNKAPNGLNWNQLIADFDGAGGTA